MTSNRIIERLPSRFAIGLIIMTLANAALWADAPAAPKGGAAASSFLGMTAARVASIRIGSPVYWLTVPAASADRVLAIACQDGRLLTWNMRDKAPELRVRHKGPVYRASYNADGTCLASASADGTIAISDGPNDRRLLKAGNRTVKFDGAAFNRVDSDRLLTSSMDNHIRLWSLERRTCLIDVKCPAMPLCTACSPDGRQYAISFENGTVSLVRADTLQTIGLVRPGGAVNCVDFSPDGTLLAAGSNDGSVTLWDCRTDKQAGPPLRLKSAALSLVFLDGNDRLAVGCASGFVALWDRATGSCREFQAGDTAVAKDIVYGLAYDPQTEMLASGTNSGLVSVWRLSSPPPAAAASPAPPTIPDAKQSPPASGSVPRRTPAPVPATVISPARS